MSNELLGEIDCPSCGLAAQVKQSKKSKPYVTCTDCGYQGFARGDAAVANIMKKMRAITGQPAPAPAPTPTPTPAPAPTPTPPKKKGFLDEFFSS